MPTRSLALAAHRTGSLRRAESLYRRAVDENPDDVDARHMLGVVLLERMRYRDALDILLDAAERTEWSVPEVRHNLGLAIAKLLAREANDRQTELVPEFLAWERSHSQVQTGDCPLVTVVVRAHDHAQSVAQAISSVVAQSYSNIELVVIDDGSRDRTVDVVRECLTGAAIPVRFVARTSPGAPASYNEGVSLARGEYVAFLDGADYYAPDRVAALVDGIARTGVLWGYSLVSGLSVDRESAGAGNAPPAAGTWHLEVSPPGSTTNSFDLLQSNVAVTAGNLFVEREFFRSVGGFRDLSVHYEWDFCLRAAGLAEPRVVRRPLYFHRGVGDGTIPEARRRNAEEADRTLSAFLATALSGAEPCTNPRAPQWPGNRALLLTRVLAAGRGTIVPVATMRRLAEDLRASHSPAPSAVGPAATASGLRKTAVVVLGMHRSGSSALARVLNLCGAYLPPQVLPPSATQNPAGYWEPEAVVDLNDRVLRQLGGAWDRVDFQLPDGTAITEEFDADARALLASEYGNEPTILLKDPRMCVLAPLWHRALTGAGYRPVYVVPVRDPLEVAQSLHARGDMSVPEGLALWLDYLKRGTEFLDSVPDVMYVRYTDLLDDWRGVVGRIAERLGVALDAVGRADEVDRFLVPGLRRQRSDDAALDALPPHPASAEIRALYGTILARCAASATITPTSRAPDHRPADILEGRPGASGATATFVMCIENNAIRDQALLLCESIRQFGGRYRNARILAFSPRAGLAVDRGTRGALADLGVEYVDEPLNSMCTEYGSANRVYAGAWAEQHSDSDFMVVLDSDTVYLDEPELPTNADVAVRPVDAKGSASRGPGDPFEDYWVALAAMSGISIDRLPYVRATIDGERIRASYNGGLIVARRAKGIFTRTAELFTASVKAGLRPYRGSGIDVYASTGPVGQAGSEYWGSNQAALAIAIWAATDRVVHYPACYNVPLHLVASKGEIDPEWLARPPVHVHYHFMFAPDLQEAAMQILAKLGVPSDRLNWLAARIPYRGPPQAKQVA